MTEQEAKTKWCCAGLSFPIEVNAAYQADPITEFTQKCQGSACMAWRWSISIQQANEINARGNTGAVASGYCGLSGKP